MKSSEERTCPQCRTAAKVPADFSGKEAICPQCGRPLPAPVPAAAEPVLAETVKEFSGGDVYHIVTDLGAGPNLRRSDNILQLKAVGIGLVGGAIVGTLAGLLLGSEAERGAAVAGGAIGGGIGGVLLGLFGSGIYLMIYRLVRHACGKHD